MNCIYKNPTYINVIYVKTYLLSVNSLPVTDKSGFVINTSHLFHFYFKTLPKQTLRGHMVGGVFDQVWVLFIPKPYLVFGCKKKKFETHTSNP